MAESRQLAAIVFLDIAGFTSYVSGRASYQLVHLPNAIIDTGQNSVYFDINNPTPTNATATGTATWGAWVHTNYGGGAIVGPVSAAGGGGLFIVDDVNIVSGNLVTLIGFRMTW